MPRHSDLIRLASHLLNYEVADEWFANKNGLNILDKISVKSNEVVIE